MNHENITQVFLHSAAEVTAGFSNTARVSAQVDKEVNVHGISVIELVNSSGASDMDLTGPLRGNALVQTKYSTAGQKTRSTLNN